MWLDNSSSNNNMGNTATQQVSEEATLLFLDWDQVQQHFINSPTSVKHTMMTWINGGKIAVVEGDGVVEADGAGAMIGLASHILVEKLDPAYSFNNKGEHLNLNLWFLPGKKEVELIFFVGFFFWKLTDANMVTNAISCTSWCLPPNVEENDVAIDSTPWLSGG